MQWLSLLFVGVLVTVRSQQQEFPYLSFMDNTLVNHSYVDINQLEDDFSNELHCFTDLVSCCRDQDGEHRGNWYSPSGTRLPFTSVEGNIYFSRRTQRVSIRRLGTVTVGHAGIYRCNIQTNAVNSDGQFEVLYVGAYLNGGDIVIPDNVTLSESMGADGLISNFTLTCISTDGPATTVTWTRDSEVVTQGTETVLNDTLASEYIHTLTVTGRVPGEYSCHVSNNKPSEAFRALTVEFEAPNAPTNLQASQNGLNSVLVSWLPGTEVTNASMVVSYIITLTSIQDSTTVQDEVDSDVTSATVTGLTGGDTYSVVVVANSHTLTSDEPGTINVTLSITEPLRVNLSATPSSEVDIGDFASITCSATLPVGLTGDVLFQWEGPGGTYFDTGSETTVVLSSIRSSQAGRYTCTASASFFEISESIDIVVLVSAPLPSIISGHGPPLYSATAYNLTCVYTLNPLIDSDPRINVGWTVDGSEVDTSNMHISIVDDTLLVFNPLTTSDSGSYTCTVSLAAHDHITVLDPQLQQSQPMEIIVQDLPPPEVATTGSSELNIGDQFVLQCNASVVPFLVVEPTLQWASPEGNVIGSGTGETLSHTVSVDGTSSAGVYVCRVAVEVVDISVSVASEISTSVRVQMPQPSVDINSDRAGILYAGTSLTLTCTVSLDSSVDTPADINIVWSGPRAIPGEWYTVTGVSGSQSPYSGSLSITPLEEGRDDGEYSCTVTVGGGSYIIPANSSISTIVNITNPPPLEVSISVAGLQLTGQRYEFECTANVVESLIQQLYLELLGPNGSSLAQLSSSMVLRYSLISLEKSDGGEYTCRASLSIPGSGVNQQTTDTESVTVVDAYPVEEFTVSSRTSSELGFSWEPPVLGRNYTLHFSLTCTPLSLDIPQPQPLSTNSGQELNLTLTRLYPGVLYNCSIVTVTDRGESEPKRLTQATEETAPSGKPLSFQAVVGVSVVTFSWAPPDVALRNGEITDYTITCDSDGSRAVSVTVADSGSHDIEGFSPSTTYNCSVVATTSAGSGPPASLTFTTLSVTVSGSSPSFDTTPVVAGIVAVVVIFALVVIVLVLVVVVSKRQRQKYRLNRPRPRANTYVSRTADITSAVVTANPNAAEYCQIKPLEGATPMFEMNSIYKQLPPGKRPAIEDEVDVTINKHVNSGVDHLYQSIDETHVNAGAREFKISTQKAPKVAETNLDENSMPGGGESHYRAPRSRHSTMTQQQPAESTDLQYSVPRSRSNTTQGTPSLSPDTEQHARIYNVPRSRQNTMSIEQAPPLPRQQDTAAYDRLESVNKSSTNAQIPTTAQANDYEQPVFKKQVTTSHSMGNSSRPSSMTSPQRKMHLVEVELGRDGIIKLATTGTRQSGEQPRDPDPVLYQNYST